MGFDEAETVLRDPLARVSDDVEHALEEDRMRVIGRSRAGWLLVVVAAMGDHGILRIISARRATRRERHGYENEIG